MKWTLVTGGAKGLGREICLALAAKGKNIVVHYRSSREAAQKLVDELCALGVQARSLQGDFATVESTANFIRSYLEDFPVTEGLVNNVGNYLVGSALHTPVDKMQQLFQENLFSTFMLIQALAPSLQKEKGQIVNIGMVGSTRGIVSTHATIYQMTKQALDLLTRSLAKELAPSHVSVNLVSPGYLETSEELPTASEKIVSLQDVTRLVAFLMDPSSRSISGQNIEVASAL
jgi:NAD(P)-dependent dehydrogenase (short-subunit alcohol dehydrogenase family)